MGKTVVAFFSGLIFAVGLGLAGMTQPQKIISFLDLWNWDPSLLLVMAGAVGVHVVTYPLVRKRKSPLLDSKWHVPNRNDITPRLIVGAMLFGIGWGIGGFCPGPAVTSLASLDARSLIFVASMLAGMGLFIKYEKFIPLRG